MCAASCVCLLSFACCCNAIGTTTAYSAKAIDVPKREAAGHVKPASARAMRARACRSRTARLGVRKLLVIVCSPEILPWYWQRSARGHIQQPSAQCELIWPTSTVQARAQEEAELQKWADIWSSLLEPLLKSSPLCAQLKEEAMIPSLSADSRQGSFHSSPPGVVRGGKLGTCYSGGESHVLIPSYDSVGSPLLQCSKGLGPRRGRGGRHAAWSRLAKHPSPGCPPIVSRHLRRLGTSSGFLAATLASRRLSDPRSLGISRSVHLRVGAAMQVACSSWRSSACCRC